MPNRIIREGFLDSERIDALTAETERLYHRLLLVCDDAGRFDNRPAMIAARCFPLKRDLRAQDVARQIDQLARAGLLIPYEFEGKPLIQLTRWAKCGKSEHSRYPWSDGNFDIHYDKVQTRDGRKEFVRSSLVASGAIDMGSAPHGHPIGTPWAPHADGVTGKTNTETETETETETIRPPDGVPPPAKEPKPPDPEHSSLDDSPRPKSPKVASGVFAELVRHYKTRWEERYPGREFHFSEKGQEGRIGKHFKEILSQLGGDLSRAKATIDAFLADGSKYVSDARHPVGLLISDFNKFQAPRAGTPTARVLDRAIVVEMP